MGMTATAGRIKLKNATGAVRFDSDEKLFIPTNFITGSVNFPNRYAQSADQGAVIYKANENNVSVLASCHASANTVRGAFSCSSTDGVLTFAYGWFNAGGTFVHEHGGGASSNLCGNRFIRRFMGYTFFCEGGSLKVRERVLATAEPGACVGGGTNTLTLAAVTLDYKLFCGTFI